MIIDAWGEGPIYTINEKKRINTWDYEHTIYVTGEYLWKLVNEIDGIPWIKWKIEKMKDIFSEKNALCITIPPRRIEYVVNAIERIGSFRDYKVYNADLNIVQSFMVKNNLHFFEDGEGWDYHLPDLDVLNVKFINSVNEMEINGEIFSNLDSSLDCFFSNLEYANIIISEGGDTYFPEFFRIARKAGYFTRTSRSRERIFTSYGRINHRKSGFKIFGLPHIDSTTSFMFNEGGLEGLVVISKITSLPLFYSARITPGTAVSSYEVRKSLEKNIMIPVYKEDHEIIKNIDTFLRADRGGLYLQPRPGIYENVFEIDFSSMYPSIIVRYNLSPETINVNCRKSESIPELGYEICMDKQGYLSEFLSDLLDLRLYYKSRKSSEERYRMRDSVLKWLLLTSFGYTGYKNAKFGRIEVHEAITSIGRQILAESIGIARVAGFEIIHGIVDSLWLRGNGNIHEVIKKIENVSRLNLSLEGHYKWIVFLPAKDGSGALNRYFGLMDNGKFKVRGIEMRRDDFPLICRKMQEDILEIYSNVNGINDFQKFYGQVTSIYSDYKDRLVRGKVDDSDLEVQIIASRYAEFYKTDGIRKRAIEKSKDAKPGDKISMFVTSEERGNVDIDYLEGRYDKKYYIRKLEMAWESISYPYKHEELIYQKTIADYD
jgi:DNA polymerase I